MPANTFAETEARPALEALPDLAAMEGTCITIYLGAHKPGSGSSPQRLRLVQMISAAEELLAARGILPTDREALLAPLREKAGEPGLHAGHAGSLVLLRSPRRFEQLRAPWDVPDQLAVEEWPLLTPLAMGLRAHPGFILLALSKRHTRLIECGPNYHRALGWPAGVPQGIETVDNQGPQHSRSYTGGGVQVGLDTSAEKEPRELHDFCRTVSHALEPLLAQKGLPLILAGAIPELAAYRALNSHPLLVSQTIEGSPDAGVSDAELAEKGREAIAGWYPPEVQHARDLYLRSGPGKKSVEVEQILRAAFEGRVMHLFLAGESKETGDVDRIAGQVPQTGTARSDHDHLANAAAVETWRHNGQVWVLDEPLDGSAIAAALRW